MPHPKLDLRAYRVGLAQLQVVSEEAVEADLHGVQVELICI